MGPLRRYAPLHRLVQGRGHNSHNGVCFDIGATTAAALRRFLAEAATPVAGIAHPSQAGNGGLMRQAPVVAAYAHDADDAELLGVGP